MLYINIKYIIQHLVLGWVGQKVADDHSAFYESISLVYISCN